MSRYPLLGLALPALLALALPALADPAPADPAAAPALAGLAGAPPSAAESHDKAVLAARAYRQAHEVEILTNYVELLALPNVAYRSSPDELAKNADWISTQLAARGVKTRLLTLDDARIPPVIYGELEVPGATKTYGVYVHYDGQPVQAEEWQSGPPFEPTLYSRAMAEGGTQIPFPKPGDQVDPEWRIYARSASDDKGPIPAILAALDALAAAGLERRANFRFFLEGEEEAGSIHLERYLETYRDLLAKIDGWLICDGPIHHSGQPQLVFGVRGYFGFELTVYGAVRELHSGHYGNWAPNPAQRLAELITSMKDRDGNVLIRGFHDGTAQISEDEKRVIDAVPDFDRQLRMDLGLAETEADNANLLDRLMISSLNVKGMQAAAIGTGARNVVPSRATANYDIRLAKGKKPEDFPPVLEAHLAAQGYHVVHEEPDSDSRLKYPRLVRIRYESGYEGVRTPIDRPFAQQVIREARRASSEKELVLMPTAGGSLPLFQFEKVLDQPIVIVPIVNHDNSQHAPDENLRLGNLWYGIELMAALFTMP